MDFDKLFPIVEQVESGGNPNAVSPRGALGPMQTMPRTLEAPGYGVRPARDASPEERRRVGQDYLKAMYDKYGNLKDTLAAYNWGPGNVDKWQASGADEAKLPAETRNYINKITGAFGQAPATPRQIDNALAAPPSREEYSRMITAGVTARFLRPSEFSDARAQRGREADREAREAAEAARPSTLEEFGAAFAGSGMVRLYAGITDRLFSDEFPAVPGYKADIAALPPAADADLIVAYGTATSPQAAEKALRKFEEEQFRVQTLMDDGAAKGVALSFAAELAGVQNWIVPYGVSKALGAAAATTIRGQVAENLLSGTAVEAATQALEGKFRPGDLAMSLAVDGLIGVGMGHLGARAASHAQAERVMAQAQAEAIQTETRLAAKAQAELGPMATPEDVTKHMDIVRAREIHEAALPSESRKVLDVTADVPAVKADEGLPTRGPEAESVPVRQALADALESPALAVVTETSRATRHLINYLQKSLPPAVQDVLVSFDGAVRGAYNAASNTVSTPGTSAKELSPAGRNDANVLAHEVVHAATGRMIAAVRDGVAGVSEGSRAAVQRLEGIRLELDAHLRAQGIRVNGRNAGADYAAGDLDEFVAQVMSDVETRKVLAGMPASSGFKDMLSAFADAVVRLLGLDPKTNNSALKEAVSLIDKIVREGEVPSGTTAATWIKTKPGLGPAQPAEVVNELAADPDAVRLGINLAPVATAADRAKAQAMLALHKKAEQWAVANPMDEKYLSNVQNLADNSVFNVASTGLLMLKSPSPLVRMIASELLEDASGVQKSRRPTAAIAKWTTERLMLGNALNDVQGAYAFWKKDKPGGFKDDLIGGHRWAQFNKEIAAEIEGRRTGGVSTKDANVRAAADSLEAAYQRIANEQRRVGTLGADALAPTSKGYMPHRMNAKAVLNLSNGKKQVLHQALVDQFITIEGWDISFADMLASKYMQRVQARAAGDYGSAIGGGNTSTASMVEEALRGMELPADTIANHMKSYTKGAANFTKKRIDLDLNKVYNTPDGEFRLLDIFDTDQISLLRAQAGRASGEVALTKFGVQGKPGLQLLRDAMQYGADGAQAGNPEREAFDQIAAEFMNEPVHPDAKQSKWMERAMAANTLVRLGGVGFNQLAESINAIFHIGAVNAAATVAAIPRLRSEIIALARGQKIDNPFLTSIEHTSGAEFGTDAYKVVMPFDSPDHAYPTYGQDTLTVTDRLLRGGTHAQAMLSGWRLIHSAQQRGMAEQIVKKIARYVNEGKDDVALQQFGIGPELRAKIKADLPNISKFDANGNPLGFDVTKLTDEAAREELIQAVWRGTAQIIQGTFIGERGKWAHDDWMKMLTQFRTFSITSMEKQWGRQRNSHGSFAAFGMLVGSMSLAIPIYMARVYANSTGRPDQEAYIEERLQPQHLARATLNYVAMSGMAGDFLDLTTALLPESMGMAPTGGRTGVESTFVGNYVAPSLSLVDDIWKYAQSPDELDEAMKLLPGSRIPYLLPFVNATKD